MKKNIFAILVFAVIFSSLAQVNGYAYNEAVPVNSTASTTLNFEGAVSMTLAVQFDKAANVTVNTISTVPSGMPAGYDVITFGTSVKGFTIDVSPPNVLVRSAVITSPPLSGALLGILSNGSNVAGAFKYDSAYSAYGMVKSSLEGANIVGTIPGGIARGSFVFGVFNSSLYPPLKIFGQAAELVANQENVLSYPKGLLIRVIPSTDNAIKIYYSDANPTGKEPKGKTSFGNYYDIETRLPSDTLDISFEYSWDRSFAKDKKLNESNVVFGYFDGSNWQFDGSVSNASLGIVYQKSTHFSVWAAYGSPAVGIESMRGSVIFMAVSLVIALLFV